MTFFYQICTHVRKIPEPLWQFIISTPLEDLKLLQNKKYNIGSILSNIDE